MAHGTPPSGATHDHGRPGDPHQGHAHRIHSDHSPLAKRPRISLIGSDEEIYGFYHRHIIVFLRGLIFPLIGAVVLGGLTLVTNAINPVDVPDWLAAVLTVGNGLLLILFGLILLWVVYVYLDWRADYLLISDRRLIVNIATPGIKTLLREVPMGKVQSSVSRSAHLNHPLQKALRVGTLVIDTAGLGQITFEDIHEKDAAEAASRILSLQKGVKANTQMPREQYRRAIVHSMIQGTAPPPTPHTIQVRSHARTGYGLWNTVFPRKPQYEGLQIIWHRHIWFLLRAEMVPLGLILLFEFTNVVVNLIGSALGITSNPVLDALFFVRPLVWLLALPFMLWRWEDWRNDKYIVTKDNLKSVDTKPFGFDETVKQTELRRVVDATVRVNGVTAKLFGFGDVVIRTPGEATEFQFDGVPRPFDVHQEIMLRLEAQREQEQVQWDRDIQDWLKSYVEERRAEPAPAPPPRVEDPWW